MIRSYMYFIFLNVRTYHMCILFSVRRGMCTNRTMHTISYRSPVEMNEWWLEMPCCSTHIRLWVTGSTTSWSASNWAPVSCCLLTFSSLLSSFSELEEFFDAGGPPSRGSKLCRHAMVQVARPQKRWPWNDLDLVTEQGWTSRGKCYFKLNLWRLFWSAQAPSITASLSYLAKKKRPWERPWPWLCNAARVNGQ